MQKIGEGTKPITFTLTDEQRKIINQAAEIWQCNASEALRRILGEWDHWQDRLSRSPNGHK